MYKRFLQLQDLTGKKSLFLLGPRQTGKSTLIRTQLPQAHVFNLLDVSLFRTLSADPAALRREVLLRNDPHQIVVIDEVQLLPELLNEVHLMIEEHHRRFVLTGSSARALRRKGVNLLGGRARTMHFHPLVFPEIGETCDLLRAINHGTLPAIFASDSPDQDLADYCGTYLKEEIVAEGLVRTVPAFSRFLETAAACNGTILNYSKIASDAEVKRSTVVDYFQILRDTLLGFDLPVWKRSRNRKAIAADKFYFFDCGVARFLAGQGSCRPPSSAFGRAFEHLILLELRAALDYGVITSLYFWRSTTGHEVDFVVNEKIAIEVKSSPMVRSEDCKGLLALREELPHLRMVVVNTADREQRYGEIVALPWRVFLNQLWTTSLVFQQSTY